MWRHGGSGPRRIVVELQGAADVLPELFLELHCAADVLPETAFVCCFVAAATSARTYNSELEELVDDILVMLVVLVVLRSDSTVDFMFPHALIPRQVLAAIIACVGEIDLAFRPTPSSFVGYFNDSN